MVIKSYAMYTAGFLLFLAIFTLAFWVLIFLSAFALPYAMTVWAIDKIKNRNKKGEEVEVQ